MQIRQRPIKRARIEIIPMIDVIFFLLVFFMVSSLSATQINGLPVALPKTAARPDSIRQNVVLTIRADGRIFLNKNPVALADLGAALVATMGAHTQDLVVVNADQKVDYGVVVRVMDSARQIGVRKFALATEASARP